MFLNKLRVIRERCDEYVLYGLARATFWLVALFPHKLQSLFITALLRIFMFFDSKHRNVALRNLKQVFPDKDEAWYKDVIAKMCISLSHSLIDVLRLPNLTPEWIKQHVNLPELAEYRKLRERCKGRGVIFAGAHVGSFELMAHALGVCLEPLHVVVRPFDQPLFNAWWDRARRLHGNQMIDRKGALRKTIRVLKEDGAIGMLFDQNVRAPNAIFVDWFGKPAATTKALGLAAVTTKTPIVIISIEMLKIDSYELRLRFFEFEDVYDNPALTHEEKVVEVTKIASQEIQKVILERPEGWFWLHRRWRTRPEGQPEDFYE